jgi:porphyrinogen peroxidase
MADPQSGIFALGDSSHVFLEFARAAGASESDVVRAVAGLHDLRKTTHGVNLVVGLRPELWCVAASSDAPSDLAGFNDDLVGPDGYRVPATQADVFIWIAGSSYDANFDAAAQTIAELKPTVSLVRELTGWVYHHNRDLTGFQDGTENPDLVEAPDVVLVPEGKPGAGGSVLLFQQWKHDFAAWRALPVAEQERVIGRTKPDSIELPEDRMPSDSHVERTTLVENGEEKKIFRRNMPYGDVGDHGTLFIGFAKERRPLHRMLERMVGVGDGIRDALTRYSIALTGSYYFVPALSTLARLL